MATNNSTINAEIVGATVEVSINVRVNSGGSGIKLKEDGYGYVMRSTNNGSFSKVSGNYSLPTDGGEGFFIQRDIIYTDSNVTNQNTYKYYFEMEINEEAGTPPGGTGTEPL